ncbi:DCN1-like protein 1 [Ceratobasidium theobromae]|uniref:Defective in cullin neddylation protein n=1 Tax=Ceratobasidium theobromae TaxID=1582974 RepID=A0A5N5QKI8_9AGAM|nr:DCN1-like protein 1 [Ceratobasidium theobromae]
MSSRISTVQRDSLVAQFRAITDASKDQALDSLKKHNYRLDAAVDAYYQALTDAPPASISTQKLTQLFDKYKDPDGDSIGIDGTIRWCKDLAIDPEDVSLLAVACELKSPSVGVWSRTGFIDGWKRLGSDSIDSMKSSILKLREKLSKDPDYFNRIYAFTFIFAKPEGARTVDDAIAFWGLLLNIGLSGSALPRKGWKQEYTDWWFEFLKEKGGKGVSKDTWAMLPEFIKVIDEKFENHDLEAAWPSTIDDFVEWAKERVHEGQA